MSLGAFDEGGEYVAAVPHDPEWRARAVCRGVDPDLFFPYQADGPGKASRRDTKEREAAALEVCATCPVTGPCLSLAIQNFDVWSISGATTPAERVALARLAGPKHRFSRQPCGTPAAYRRHLRDNEPACDPCKQAHSKDISFSKALRRATVMS